MSDSDQLTHADGDYTDRIAPGRLQARIWCSSRRCRRWSPHSRGCGRNRRDNRQSGKRP